MFCKCQCRGQPERKRRNPETCRVPDSQMSYQITDILCWAPIQGRKGKTLSPVAPVMVVVLSILSCSQMFSSNIHEGDGVSSPPLLLASHLRHSVPLGGGFLAVVGNGGLWSLGLMPQAARNGVRVTNRPPSPSFCPKSTSSTRGPAHPSPLSSAGMVASRHA